MNEYEKLMLDSAKEIGKSGKTKDRIIMLLIVLLFLEAVCFFGCLVWYESQTEHAVISEQQT